MRASSRGPRLVTLVVLLGVATSAPGLAQDPATRRPLPKGPICVTTAYGDEVGPEAWDRARLFVKFVDAARVRATAEGGLVSTAGLDLSEVQALALQHGVTFGPGLELPSDRLAALEQRAEEHSGARQPDLAGLLEALVSGASPGALLDIGERLQEPEIVEFVWLETPDETPARDILPLTPDLTHLQSFVGPAPGLDFEAAREAGLTGAGVRWSDVEYGWIVSHEDLVDQVVHPEPGKTVHPEVEALGYDQHGTAVLGILAATENEYGVTGVVPDAELYTFPAWTVEDGVRVNGAILAAADASEAGDVILLELQTGSGAPLEIQKTKWLLIKAATDAGIVVVEAAGNGAKDLDSPGFSAYQGWGDSGAILVGAGSADMAHDKLSFSTYGSRVDVQAWGESVATLGYGWYAKYGGDPDQAYTAWFSGTSSASALASAAVVAVQQAAKELYLKPLGPIEMRKLLTDTGVSQGDGGHIGPCVDVGAALAALVPPWTDEGGALAGAGAEPRLGAVGVLEPEGAVVFTLSEVRPGLACWLVLGASRRDAPFKGGVMVPAPDLVIGPWSTNEDGRLELSDTVPADAVSGQQVYAQFWIIDSEAPQGAAASNALFAAVP